MHLALLGSMPSDINGIKKTAILLLSLPQDEASEILKRLPAEAVEEVSREIASLGEIAMTTRKDVFGEFYNLALANSYVSEGGLGICQAAARSNQAQRRRRQPRHQAGDPAGPDNTFLLPAKGGIGKTC